LRIKYPQINCKVKKHMCLKPFFRYETKGKCDGRRCEFLDNLYRIKYSGISVSLHVVCYGV
jgi:hypothetical protein